MLLRQLEFAYRMDELSFPTAKVAAEIHALLSMCKDNGKDAALSKFVPQYQAGCHMWMAFHAHRHSSYNGNTSSSVLQQATLASEILQRVFPTTPHSISIKSPKRSPKARIAQGPKVVTRTSPRKKPTTTKISPKPSQSMWHVFIDWRRLMSCPRNYAEATEGSTARTIANDVNIR